MAYTQEIYVSTLGNDTTGTGASSNPYATISKAMTSITTTDPIIYVASGTYTITDLKSLTKASTNTTIRGKYINTIIQCSTGSTYTVPYLGKLDIIDCILSPSATYGGDTRMLSYSNDNIEVNFRNVVFRKNGTYPTLSYFAPYPTASTANRNKNFYNCTFLSALPPSSTGAITCTACATENTTFGVTVVAPTDSQVSCVFDSNYKITNYSNITYGVYSGAYSWLSVTYFIHSINTGLYYTIIGDAIIQTTLTSSSDIENNGFLLSAFSNTALNSQILKDISPFKIKAFSTSPITKTSLQLNGQKSTKELVVPNQEISTLTASTIDRFILTKTLVGTGDVKLVISNDSKNTWKTWNGSTWTTLTYKESNGNAFRDEIWSVGMSSDTLSSANVNLINTNDTFNFAYVISKPLYNDDAIINKLSLVYNSKVHYTRLENKDVKVDVSEDYIKFIPVRDITKMKVNIMV